MSEENKSEQTAVDQNDDTAKPVSEEKADAQGVSDDFDKALSEWEASDEGSSSEQQDEKESDDDVKSLLKELKDERKERQQQQFQSDLKNVVGEIRGDFTTEEVEDDHIDIWLDKQARKDKRVASAWMNRHNDPAKFERTVNALKSKFAKEHDRFRVHDKDTTADREAVADAVRGKSRSAPEGQAPHYENMSDAEFRDSVKKEHGFTPQI